MSLISMFESSMLVIDEYLMSLILRSFQPIFLGVSMSQNWLLVTNLTGKILVVDLTIPNWWICPHLETHPTMFPGSCHPADLLVDHNGIRIVGHHGSLWHFNLQQIRSASHLGGNQPLPIPSNAQNKYCHNLPYVLPDLTKKVGWSEFERVVFWGTKIITHHTWPKIGWLKCNWVEWNLQDLKEKCVEPPVFLGNLVRFEH